MQLVPAHTTEHLPAVRGLFVEYAEAIEVDLDFQGFDGELAELPGRYAPPTGRLFLALEAGRAAGCVALRKLDVGVCEMKRLYVRPLFRRRGLGRQLAHAAIASARETGYVRMLLDTLGSMEAALALYERLGFQRIAAYYDNPVDDAVYMELTLG